MLNRQSIATRLRRSVESAVRSETGAVAPLLGLMLLMLIGCVGVAVDTGRAMVVKARLASALDAAGLAVGARVTTADYTADAKKFVNANFKTNYAGATVVQDSVKATLSSDKQTISLTASATMPTIFMKLFGSTSVTVNASSEITRASTGLELVMVLDNTGSMEESNSMTALKTGAKQLVDGLFKDNPTDVYVGLVPFSQAVSIGPIVSNTNALLTPLLWTDVLDSNLGRYGYPGLWTGCVEERLGGLDQTDDPPVITNPSTLFKSYYSPSSSSNTWLYFGVYPVINYRDWTYQRGPGAYCPKPVTPMTQNKSKITAAIDAMTAQGSTFINVGAVWGWRMLSPRWRGVWGGDMPSNKLPLDYNTKNMNKAMILMTDGQNSFGANNYTAYSYLSDKRLGTDDTNTANGILDTRLLKVCGDMKAKGVTVVTIAYAIPDADTKALLQSCATNTSLAFDAKNTSDLVDKFGLILGALSKLRVSK